MNLEWSQGLERSQGLESLTNGALLDRLRGLEEEERTLSDRRRELHERMGDDVDVDLLAALQAEERELSERRLQVHLQISQLRIERGSRLSSLRAHLRAVE